MIVVHGVADQQRGETVQAVAALLASACGGTGRREDRSLSALPIRPLYEHAEWPRTGWAARFYKSLVQSWRTDFLGSLRRQRAGTSRRAGAATQAASEKLDLGTTFTDYLLAKRDWPSAKEVAEVAVVRVRAAQLQADVFEMYWADLSRVQGVSSVLSELVTLLLRFSRLSTEALAVGTVHDPARSMRWLSGVQRGADWLFSRVLGACAMQLVMCTLILLPAEFLAHNLQECSALLSGLVGLGSAAALVYFGRIGWPLAVLAGAGFAVVSGVPLATSEAYSWLMLSWIALLSFTYLRLLLYWEERFRAALGTNLILYACVLFGLWHSMPGSGPLAERWIVATVSSLEGVILAHAVLWPVAGLMIAASVALYLGAWIGGSSVRRQVLVTSRLGLFTSVGAFLVLLMFGLQIVVAAIPADVAQVCYPPWHFPTDLAHVCYLPKKVPLACELGSSVGEFLCQRAAWSSAGFAVLALLLLGLLGFIVLIFLPSVLRELRLLSSADAGALGAWLTHGYRGLEQFVGAWGLLVAPCALLMALMVLANELRRSGLESAAAELTRLSQLGALSELKLRLIALSQIWLRRLAYGAAGGTVGVLALGKLVRWAKALRVPLDAAFDVDNHFREFPRKAISRVLILERYLGLLAHLRDQGYTRVVIVAHSQGTVITAELLRYLRQRAALDAPATPDPEPTLVQLAAWLEGSGATLLTLGCPLRQLYALRFPDMYDWVLRPVTLASGATWRGPRPAELGVARWLNLWGSGDYVGRWLWSAPAQLGPLALQVTADRYAPEELRGWDGATQWSEVCIGADAHTHYFDLDQRAVAAALHDCVSGSGARSEP